MKNSLFKVFGPLALAGGLAACSNIVDPKEAFCANRGDGPEIVDAKSGETEISMGRVFQQREDYVWGEAVRAPDENGNSRNSNDFNVYLKNGEIASCMVGPGEGGVTYKAAPSGP